MNNEHAHLTKAQRKQLAKEARQKPKTHARLKRKIWQWSLISFLMIALLVIGYVAFLHKPNISGKGVLRLARSTHNFGIVMANAGVVSTTVPLVNIGEGELVITGLNSSCGCTSANVVNQGQEGPRFSMAGHGQNPKNWQTVITPGEQAFLKVDYDPAAHPELLGLITRIVTIYSDDPLNPAQEFRIEVNQRG